MNMDDFVERMLNARRTLDQALTDIVAKCHRIPRSKERCLLERMIEVLKDEISLRQNKAGRGGVGSSFCSGGAHC